MAHLAMPYHTSCLLHRNCFALQFPITLCVSRLSGIGTETLYIGVMRHDAAAAAAAEQVVKVCPAGTRYEWRERSYCQGNAANSAQFQESLLQAVGISQCTELPLNGSAKFADCFHPE
jgi:hypothetical protein